MLFSIENLAILTVIQSVKIHWKSFTKFLIDSNWIIQCLKTKSAELIKSHSELYHNIALDNAQIETKRTHWTPYYEEKKREQKYSNVRNQTLVTDVIKRIWFGFYDKKHAHEEPANQKSAS